MPSLAVFDNDIDRETERQVMAYYRSDHAHEAALINTKGDIFCGGGTKSASRMCPPGQNPLADSVRGDRIS